MDVILDEDQKEPSTDTSKARLIVADDEESMRHFLGRSLRRRGFEVEVVSHGLEAIEAFDEKTFDVGLIDLKMPGKDGLEVLAHFRRRDPNFRCVLMTAYGSIATAVEAMKLGAFDFVTKPFEIDELVMILKRALTPEDTSEKDDEARVLAENRDAYAGLIGQSQAMKAIFETIELLRDSDATVLIEGESGTGKELVARAIHLNSLRSSNAFVAVNCAAIPDGLFENELFGHERGAYTGATVRREGLIERANQGTLFLDEVTEIDPLGQVKLLRFLQEQEITPLGGSDPVKVDVRVVAASNRPMDEEVRNGRLREDLYWRLNVVPMLLPPLRDRREDVPLLVAHFLQSAGATESSIVSLSEEALKLLTHYDWPGNVRELQNAIERLLVLREDREVLGVEDLPQSIVQRASPKLDVVDQDVSFADALADFERRYITGLLQRAEGNVTHAARLSGLSRPNLHRKMRSLGIESGDFRR